jgi:hypothetical protein
MKITIDADLMKRALGALKEENYHPFRVAENYRKKQEAIAALRAAIEQAEGQEPQKVGIEEIRLWALRHDVNGSDLDLRCAFEDARTHPAPAQPVQEPSKQFHDWAVAEHEKQQPALKPLSDEQTRSGFCQSEEQWTFRGMSAWQVWQKAKAWTESAHGIKEQA